MRLSMMLEMVGNANILDTKVTPSKKQMDRKGIRMDHLYSTETKRFTTLRVPCRRRTKYIPFPISARQSTVVRHNPAATLFCLQDHRDLPAMSYTFRAYSPKFGSVTKNLKVPLAAETAVTFNAPF